MMNKMAVFLVIALATIAFAPLQGWGAELVFEQHVESAQGAPVAESFSFDGTGFENLTLRVVNGEPNGDRRVSSAVIAFNGIQVLGPADLNQKVGSLSRLLATQEGANVLEVSLRSNPGGVLLVQVHGELSLNLPPDPGPAGDLTLAGVDVNGNGVRDDIERWIGLTFRNSEKARQGFTQLYYPLQGFVVHADQGDRDAVYDDMTALQRAGECLYYIFEDEKYALSNELEARVLNTPARVKAYTQASRMLGGGSFPGRSMSKWKQSCTFDSDAMEN